MKSFMIFICLLFINTTNIKKNTIISEKILKPKIEIIQSDMYIVVFSLNKIESSLNNLNDNLIKLDSIKNANSTRHTKR